ncbi:MAG: P-type conjugative transfer protein TrbL [Stellaceae bacterium]
MFAADVNSHGLSDWTCPGCDSGVSNAVNSGQLPASGYNLSTNPADYAALDTPSGLQSYFASNSGTGSVTVSDPTGSLTVSSPATGTGTMGTLTNGSLDQIVQHFQSLSQGWTGAFLTAAQGLFWLLWVIEAGYSAFGIVMRPETYGDWHSWIIRQVLAVTFWQFVMTNATTWMTDIVSGFQWLAGQAGSAYTTPSAIFEQGVNLASTVTGQLSLLHPVNSTGLILCAVLILLGFVFIAALLIEVLAEAWFITGMAALFVAFGALRFSRDIAISCIRHAVAIGFKLLALSLLVGAGSSFLQSWSAQVGSMKFQQIFVMLGSTIVLSIISKRVPDRVQSVALGSPGSWGAEARLFRETVGAAALAAAPVLAVGGLGAAAVAAGRYGAQELKSRADDGSAPESRAARLGVVGGAAGRALASAAASEIGNRLGGRYRAGGMATARVAQTINNRRRLNEANQPPQGNP